MKTFLKSPISVSLAAMFLLTGCGEKSIITGTVLDEAAQPVSGATVKIDGTQLKTETDIDGHFSLSYVPGTFDLVISQEGYSHFSTELNLATPAEYPMDPVYLFRIPEENHAILLTTTQSAVVQPSTVRMIPLFTADSEGALKTDAFKKRELAIVSGPVIESSKAVDLFGSVFRGDCRIHLARVSSFGVIGDEGLAFEVVREKSLDRFSVSDDRTSASVMIFEAPPEEGLYAFHAVKDGARSVYLIRFTDRAVEDGLEEGEMDGKAALLAALEEASGNAQANKDWKAAFAHLGDVAVLRNEQESVEARVLELFRTAMKELMDQGNGEQMLELAKVAKNFEATRKWAAVAIKAATVEEDYNEYQAAQSKGSLARMGAPGSSEVMAKYLARGDLLYFLGYPERAAADYRKAMEVDSTYSDSIHKVAWRFATDPDPRFRNPDLAIAYGMEGKEQFAGGGRMMEAIAAGYAGKGDFELAEYWQLQSMIDSRPPADLLDAITRCQMYHQQMPYLAEAESFRDLREKISSDGADAIVQRKADLVGDWRSPNGIFHFNSDGSSIAVYNRNGFRVDGKYSVLPTEFVQYLTTHKNGEAVPQSTDEDKILFLNQNHCILKTDSDEEWLLTRVDKLLPDLSADFLQGTWSHANQWKDGTAAVISINSDGRGRIRAMDKDYQNEAMHWELIGDVIYLHMPKFFQCFRVTGVTENSFSLLKLNHSSRTYLFRRQE